MTAKPESLFGSLFGGAQETEEYLRALEKAARWLAEAEGLTLSEYLRTDANQKEKGWIN